MARVLAFLGLLGLLTLPLFAQTQSGEVKLKGCLSGPYEGGSHLADTARVRERERPTGRKVPAHCPWSENMQVAHYVRI